MGPRQRLLCPPFTLGSCRGLSLRLWPHGDTGSAGEGKCTLRVVNPNKGKFRFAFTVGNFHKTLTHEFSGKPGQDRGWRNFCVLEDAIAHSQLVISLTLTSKDGEAIRFKDKNE